MALRKWFPLLVVSQRVVGVGFFPHGWAGYAPKAGALPTALHPDMKLWGGLGGFSQSKRATNCATPGFLRLPSTVCQGREPTAYQDRLLLYWTHSV